MNNININLDNKLTFQMRWFTSILNLNLCNGVNLMVVETLVFRMKVTIHIWNRSNQYNKVKHSYENLRKIEKSKKKNNGEKWQKEKNFLRKFRPFIWYYNIEWFKCY